MRLSLLALVPCVLALAACGGSGGSDTAAPGAPSAPLAPVVLQTAITTPAVSGMRFVACGNGATCLDDVMEGDGSFTMVAGGSLDLFVGPLHVLSARGTAQAVTSVFEFSPTGDETDTGFVNRMTLLYSLDADADPTNGIQVSEEAATEVAALPYAQIDFGVPSDAFVANPVLQSLLNAVNAVDQGVSLTVRDPAAVRETLKRLSFAQRFAGEWTLALGDAGGTEYTLVVGDTPTATVNGTLSFELEPLSHTELNVRFYRNDLGSFIGKIRSDGSGSGTWSLTGATPSAGFWAAKRAAPTDD